MEGMAEYLSIGELDPHTQAWLRDAVLSGYLRTIPEMSRYSDYLSYRFGQSLWAFVGGKYGDETIGLLLRRALRLGLEAALEVTLGVSVAQLSDEWIEYVRTTYLPEVASHASGDELGGRLTAHRFRPGSREFASYLSPALSPDGRRIVYLSDRGNAPYSFYDLWLASAEDGKVLGRLVKAARTADFESLRFLTSSATWSPDGRNLAFVAKVKGRDALYLYDVQRRRVVQKIDLELDGMQNPTFSPDGLRIAFTGIRGGMSDLYVVDASGDNLERLTDDKYADLHPSWSPDGRYIAIATDRGDQTDFDQLVFGNLKVALYSVGRGDIELLPGQEQGKNINPVWSPDSDAIAFVSDRSGVSNVFIWSLSEKRLYQATDLLSGVSGITPLSPAISWSARADRLALTYFEGAGYNIYVVDDPRSRAHPVGTAPAPLIALETDNGGRDGLEFDSAGALPATEEASQSFYRMGVGFRRSDLAPSSGERVARSELTVSALMADARSGLPDTASFERRDYEVRLTPDVIGRPVIGAQVGGFFGSGVYGGSYVLLSDMMGDHNVLLWGQIAGSFSDAYLLTRYTYLRERPNLSMAYQQFPIYRFRGSAPIVDGGSGQIFEDRFVRDVYRTLSTELHYPFNRFQRLEVSGLGVHLSRDSVVDQLAVGFTDTGGRVTRRLETLVFAGPTVALVGDNTLFGFTGPIAGRRYRIELGRFFGDVSVNTVTLDFRNYWNLGGQYALATRVTTYGRSGPDENEFRVYWGGPYFIRGYDGGSFSLDECSQSAQQVRELVTTFCPVRDQLIGSSVAFASAEFRFPIFSLLDLGFVPLGLPPVDGVIFFDVGAAFNSVDQLVWSRRPGFDPYRVREPLASYGAGIRVNILYNVVRLDYAIPLDRPHRKGGVWSIAFGPAF